MAIYCLHASIITRSSGKSSVASAAYRAGEKIRNDYDGVTHDYRCKTGVVHSEIFLPKNAPSEYADRSTLWNAVEKAESRKDAQTAREVLLALPVEFSRDENIAISCEYISKEFVSRGMVADFALHDTGEGNPHAHIMLTTREVGADGFGKKNRDWNSKSLLISWRKDWANLCNEKFKEKGLRARIDERTLEAQGIDREPTIHLGVAAHSMEKRGIRTERGDMLREIIARNRARESQENPYNTAILLHELKEGYVIADREISSLEQELFANRQEAQRLFYQAEEVDEKAGNIKVLEGRVKELQGERSKLGLFDGAKKKALEGQIESLTRSKEQAEGYFLCTYGDSYVNAQRLMENARKQIEARSIMEKRLQSQIAELRPLHDEIQEVYRSQRLLAETRKDYGDIAAKVKALEAAELRQNNATSRPSARDMLSRSQSLRNLDNITEKDFTKALESLPFTQAHAVKAFHAENAARELFEQERGRQRQLYEREMERKRQQRERERNRDKGRDFER